MKIFAIILFLSASLSCGDNSPNNVSIAAAETIHGAWIAVSVEFLGQQVPGDPGIKLTFTAEKVIWEFETPDGKKIHDGVYRWDPAKSPKELDLAEPEVMNPEQMLLGIYKMEDDTLTVYMGVKRPRDFSDDTLTRLVLVKE